MSASYLDVSLSMWKVRRSLPMVSCASSPVTRVSRSPLSCEKRSAWGGGCGNVSTVLSGVLDVPVRKLDCMISISTLSELQRILFSVVFSMKRSRRLHSCSFLVYVQWLATCKRVQNSLGFWNLHCGLIRILVSGFWITIPIVSGIPDYLDLYAGFQIQDARFHKQKFPGFQIPK